MIVRSRQLTYGAFFVFVVALITVLIVCALLDYEVLAYSSFVLTTLGIATLLISGYRVLSLPVILVAFLYLFHFGQTFLDIVIGTPKMQHLFFYYKGVDQATYNISLYYSTLSIGMIVMGALMIPVLIQGTKSAQDITCRLDKSIKNRQNQVLELNSLTIMRCFSVAVLIIAFPALLYMDVSKFVAVRTSGYLATYEIYSAGPLKYIEIVARLARPALLLLMISFCKRPNFARHVLSFSMVYYSLSMMTGDRGTNAIFLVTNLSVFFTVVRRPKLSDAFMVLLALIVLVVLITSVSTFRDMKDMSFRSFLESISSRRSSGFLSNSIREFGGSIETVYLTVKNYPTRTAFLCGFTYFVSPLYMFPVLPKTTLNWEPLLSYTLGFLPEERASLGGSLIGEAYANFGWHGLALIFAFGVIIGIHSYTLQKSIQRRSWANVGLLAIPFPFVVLWTRDYYVTIFNVSFLMGIVMWMSVRILAGKLNIRRVKETTTVCLILGKLDYSGAEKIAVALLNVLHQRGYETHAILTATENVSASHPNIIQHPIYNMAYEETHSRVRRSIKRIIRLIDEMRKLNADVYVSFGALTNIDAILASQFTKGPMIACERSNPVYDPKSRIARVRRKLTYWLSDYFVFQTAEIQALFSYAIQSRSVVIPNFVEKIKPTCFVKKPQFVTVARLSNDSKNHLLLINAFGKVHSKHPDYRLVFCGDGPDKALYDNHIKGLGLEENVIFMGMCTNPIEIVQQSEVFVLSSLYEGMPNALMEALASGAACVSTNCYGGGASSLIINGENGLLVPNQDVMKLAEAMELLITEKETAARMRVRASEISQTHSLEVIADIWIEFFSMCVRY